MSSAIDTDEWHLRAFMEWVPAKDKVTCTGCRGTGKVGGGFKDMDGPRDCGTCGGRGQMTYHPKSPKPEVPKVVIEHMRKAWIAYWEVL